MPLAGFKKFNVFVWLVALTVGLFFGSVSTVRAASLYISPASLNTSVGNIVSVKVFVGTAGKSVNNAEGTLLFPVDLFDVVSVSKNTSIFSLWVEEPKFSNAAGTVTFNGGLPNPGYVGDSGEVMTVTFRTKKAGTASVLFSDSVVRENDGLGTDILTAKGSAQIVISTPVLVTPVTDEEQIIVSGAPKAPLISSKTNPDQDKWYSDSNPVFSWGIPPGITAVRLQYDRNSGSIPSISYSGGMNEKQLTGLSDGRYYFHAQFKNAQGWGAVGHFRFNIDTAPPNRFTITEYTSQDAQDGRLALNFKTTDSGSGMDRYEVKIGNDEFKVVPAAALVSKPYIADTQEYGNKTIVVNAYDKAGNVTTSSVTINIKSISTPTISEYPSEIQEGESLRIIGKSYPESTVVIYLKDQNGVESSQSIVATQSGDFTMLWGTFIHKGLYSITAQTTDKNGVKSALSSPYTLVVKEQTVYRVGYLVINYLSLIILIIAALALIIGTIMYSHHKLSLLRRKIRKTVSNTENVVRHRFDALEKEMARHFAALELIKSKRQLTKEEKDIFSTLQNYLEDTEKDIEGSLEALKKESE